MKHTKFRSKSKITFFIVFIGILTVACNKRASNLETQRNVSSPNINATTISEKSWNYYEQTDEMTSDKIKVAEIEANNLLFFSFPYDGGSTAMLIIRKREIKKANADSNSNKQTNTAAQMLSNSANKLNEDKSEIILSVSKGQFLHRYGNRSVKLRFDEDEPFDTSFSEPTSGSYKIVFLSEEEKILSNIKTAQKLKIEAEFFNDGKKIMEFNVKDFKW